MLSYASLVKHDHPKTISTSRSHLLGTSESRQSYNSNSKKASYVDWGRSSVLPNGRMLASMCLMPATKRNKEDKVLRLGTREARLPNTMDSMSVPCAHCVWACPTWPTCMLCPVALQAQPDKWKEFRGLKSRRHWICGWKMRLRKKNLFTCILSVTNQNKYACFSLELLGRKLNIFPCCMGMLSEKWLFSPLLLI